MQFLELEGEELLIKDRLTSVNNNNNKENKEEEEEEEEESSVNIKYVFKDEYLESAFRRMWGDNGDHMSLLYAGTWYVCM